MKPAFRSIIPAALITVASFFAVTYVACKKDAGGDKCKAISCAHGATCTNGVCTCPAGYEGTYCETASRDKFIRSYSVTEKGSVTPNREYPIAINSSAAITDVTIQNLYNYFKSPVRAYIVNDTIFIPNQQMEGKVVFGKGYIHGTDTTGNNLAITMSYEIVDTATQLVDDFGYYHTLDNSSPSEWK